MRGKKAMSPLIATVLLIAFAVALGAMIMNWSEDEATPIASNAGGSCEAVSLELNEVFGKQIFCYQEPDIRFNLVNSGGAEIQGVQLRTVNEDLKEVKMNIPSSRIAIGGTFSYENEFDKSGKVHVELIPYVIEGNQPVYCRSGGVVQDILPDCSA